MKLYICSGNLWRKLLLRFMTERWMYSHQAIPFGQYLYEFSAGVYSQIPLFWERFLSYDLHFTCMSLSEDLSMYKLRNGLCSRYTIQAQAKRCKKYPRVCKTDLFLSVPRDPSDKIWGGCSLFDYWPFVPLGSLLTR